MTVNYSKLWILLINKKISKPQLKKAAELSPATFTKLNQNKFVSMEVMARICKALNCDIGDVMTFEIRGE